MVIPRTHHALNTPIPQVLWDKISKEAEDAGISVTRVLVEILRSRYDVPAESLPKPKRAGRKPKRKKR